MTIEALPGAITVYEVGARDGLQNEQATVPTEVKAEFIRRLMAAGVRAIELTSFVSPEVDPPTRRRRRAAGNAGATATCAPRPRPE